MHSKHLFVHFINEKDELMSPQVLEQRALEKKIVELSDKGLFETAVAILDKNKGDKLNLNIFSADRLSPLMYAGIKGNEFAFNAFIKKGADINLQDQLGNTAVIYAVEFGRHLILKNALENGANPNIQNKKGINILMITARNNDLDGARIIIGHSKVNPFLKNHDGVTALEIARKNKLFDIEKLFVEYEKRYKEIIISERLFSETAVLRRA